MNYHLSKKVALPFNEAVLKVTEELKKEGFGVLTTIDLKEKFREKLNEHFRNYVILGACNPRYAYEALQEENKVGVFLPCNVVVQQHDSGEVEVSIINPEETMQKIDNLNIKTFATEIKESLETVLKNL